MSDYVWLYKLLKQSSQKTDSNQKCTINVFTLFLFSPFDHGDRLSSPLMYYLPQFGSTYCIINWNNLITATKKNEQITHCVEIESNITNSGKDF